MNKNALKILALVVVVGMVLGQSIVSASFDKKDWQYERVVDKGNISGMVKIKLPNDISWITENFRDLRVVDDLGVETPFVLTNDIRPTPSLGSASIINSVTSNDGSTKFVVDTGRGGVVRTSLFIETNKPNYRRQVSLYSSDNPLALDDSRWSLVSKEGYVFSFTDPATGQSQGKNSIDFSSNTSRYFKVVISNGEEGPVVANDVKVYGDIDVVTPRYSTEVPVSVYNNPNRKTTELTIDLGRSGVYSDSISISSKDTNYTRRVIVEASNSSSTDNSWSYVGQGYISSVRTSLYKGSSNIINYGSNTAIRSRFIRLSIVNDDNPVISIDPKVVVSGPVFELVFDAKPGRNYKVYYGNPSAQKPQYDISNLASYIETAKLPVLGLGSETKNSSYVEPAGPVVPFTEANKWLLNTFLVIIVLVIAIGIGLYLKKYLSNNKHSDFPSDNIKPEDQTGQIGGVGQNEKGNNFVSTNRNL